MLQRTISTPILLPILCVTLFCAPLCQTLRGVTPASLPADTNEMMGVPSPNADSTRAFFASVTRAPAVRIGTCFNWMIMIATLGARVEFEPVRDVVGIWGSIGWAAYPVAPANHGTPSELELAAGLRIHPLPFGEIGRLYVEGGKKSYWDLDLWSLGVGCNAISDYRVSRLGITFGFSYEWGEDNRPIAEPGKRWSWPWIGFGLKYGFEI